MKSAGVAEAGVEDDCVDQDKRRTETTQNTSTHKQTRANRSANRVAVSTSRPVERPCPSSDGSLRADTGRSPSQRGPLNEAFSTRPSLRGLRPGPIALGSISPDGHSDDFSTLYLNLATCRPIGTGRKHQSLRRPPQRTANIAPFGMKANHCSAIGIGFPRLMRFQDSRVSKTDAFPRLMRGPSPENERRRPYFRQTRASALGGHPRGP